jgi:tight adherence protein B
MNASPLARRWRRRRLGVAIVAGTALLLAAPAAFGAAGDPPPAPALFVRGVDSTDPTQATVTFTYDGAAADANSVEIAENGKKIEGVSAPAMVDATNGGTATVVVIDASESAKLMLDDFKTAALSFLATSQGSGVVGVVSTNRLASVRSGLTNDVVQLTAAINGISAGSEGGLWTGVQSAAGMLRSRPDLVPNIFVLTDGNSISQADAGVTNDVLNAGAAFYAVGIDAGNLDPTSFIQLASATGGRYEQHEETAAAKASADGVAHAVVGTFRLTYPSKAAEGLNALAMQIGDSVTRASFVAGSVTKGTAALAPQAPIDDSGFLHIEYFREHGKMLGIVLVIIAAILGAYAIGNVLVRDQSGLSAALQPYADGYTHPEDESEERSADKGAAQTALIQRAVALTGQFAERQGLLQKVEAKLERANLPLRAAEAIFFYVAAAGVLTMLTLVLSQNLLMTLIAGIIIFMIPFAVLNYMATRRQKQFHQQLPDMLQLLSGTLRAGYSMMQGVEAVSQEVAEPMGRELRRVVTEARLGRPLEESLQAVGERMESNDFKWAVMAIRIQREVGGNLSELLMTVAETMTQRERLRRDINALTAEGKVSSIVLGILPVGLGLAMWVINPEYMETLFKETSGQFALVGAVLLMGFGFAWMWKIIQIEV